MSIVREDSKPSGRTPHLFTLSCAPEAEMKSFVKSLMTIMPSNSTLVEAEISNNTKQ